MFFCLFSSPWYNRTGWLGVKHQLTYSPYFHLFFILAFFALSFSPIFLTVVNLSLSARSNNNKHIQKAKQNKQTKAHHHNPQEWQAGVRTLPSPQNGPRWPWGCARAPCARFLPRAEAAAGACQTGSGTTGQFRRRRSTWRRRAAGNGWGSPA